MIHSSAIIVVNSALCSAAQLLNLAAVTGLIKGPCQSGAWPCSSFTPWNYSLSSTSCYCRGWHQRLVRLPAIKHHEITCSAPISFGIPYPSITCANQPLLIIRSTRDSISYHEHH